MNITISIGVFCILGFVAWIFPDANYKYILLGFCGTLIIQLIILLAYIFNKIRIIFYRSKVIINPNNEFIINDPSEIEFKEREKQRKKIKKLYLNKYSEEARLEKQTQKIYEKRAVLGFDSSSQEPRVNYRKSTTQIIKKIQIYQKILEKLNQAPIRLGQALKEIGKVSIFQMKQYKFITFEQTHNSYIDDVDMTAKQKQLFNQKKIKYELQPVQNTKLKRMPTKEQKQFRYQNIQERRRYYLPGWKHLKFLFVKMGEIFFLYMEEIKKSNSHLILITHSKYSQQQQTLISALSEAQRNIKDMKYELQRLKQDEQQMNNMQYKYESQTSSNIEHQKLVYNIKKGFRKFLNLENKIKLTERELKQWKEKEISAKKNLENLENKFKHPFIKNLKNSFRLFIDAYFNSVVDTIIFLQKNILSKTHRFQQCVPPIIHKQQIQNSLIKLLQSQQQYQREYINYTVFHLNELIMMEQAINDLKMYLLHLYKTLLKYFEDYQSIKKETEKYLSDKYVKNYVKWLESTKNIIQIFKDEIHNLIAINLKFYQNNIHEINLIKIKIKKYIDSTQESFSNLKKQYQNLNRNGLLYTNQSSQKFEKCQNKLEEQYKQLNSLINHVLDFKIIFIKHTNRLKKTFLYATINFLYDQRKQLCKTIEIVDIKNAYTNQYQGYTNSQSSKINNEAQQQQNKENKSESEDEHEEVQMRGKLISDKMMTTLNKFLFTVWIQWCGSERFRNKIKKALYIMFNEQGREGYGEIEINNLNLSGPAPEIHYIRNLPSDEEQVHFDINLSFRGSIALQIKTKYTNFVVLDLAINVEIKQLNLITRICFVPRNLGKGWFSFIGETVQEIDMSLQVQEMPLDFSMIKKFLRGILTSKLNSKIFPMKASLRVPLSKKNNKKQKIRERIKQQKQKLLQRQNA